MFEGFGRAVLPGEQVADLPPGLDDRFLSVPVDGVHYFAGTAIPMVSTTYRESPSGLIVPDLLTRQPHPLDSVATYLSGADFGQEIPAEVTINHLRQIPFQVALRFCTDLLRIVDDPRSKPNGAADPLRPMFSPSAWRRLKALCDDGKRMLVAPQVLLVLLKYAAIFSGDCLLAGVAEGSALIAMLGTADDLGRQEAEDDGRRTIDGSTPGILERHVVAAHHFHTQLEFRHLVAKFVRRWKQYPVERPEDTRVVDLPVAFYNSLGVTLDDWIAIGMALYLASIGHGPVVPRSVLHDLNLNDPAAVERVLRMICRGPDELRAWARATSASAWEFSYLEQFPVIDFGEDLLLVRPRWLLQRFFGWLPMFDLHDGLGEGRAAKKQAAKIKSCLEYLGEIYACETLYAQVQRHNLRVFDEATLKKALYPGREQGRICDVAIDDGRRWALFEITTSQLNRESATSASALRLDDDFAKLVGEIDQLDQTIRRLRGHEATLTGQPSARFRGFYPVLVMTEGFPVNPVTLTALRERARVAGMLQGDDVAELEVVDGVELEILEGAELAELSVLDALEAKSRSALRRSNLRDFLLREYGLNATTPQRVRRLADVAIHILRRAVTQPGDAGAA